jgi:dihydrofolate synthase/folylpolyglutamate synthase
VAVGVLETLAERGYNITPRGIVEGLRQVRWPGRFQIIRNAPRVVIDGAHNPQSAHQLNIALHDYLKDRPQGRKALVIGMSSDKDIEKVVAELAPIFSLVIATRSRHPRALDAERLAAYFSGYDCEVRKAASVAEAMDMATALAQGNGLICATGSLFIVGEALEWAGLPGC